MTSTLLSLYEVADRPDVEETLGAFKASARPQAVVQNYVRPSDRELALNLNQGVARLQDSMDAASKAVHDVHPLPSRAPAAARLPSVECELR